MKRFDVYLQVAKLGQNGLIGRPDRGNRSRYRILETYDTSDGIRTRIVDGQWDTEDEAITEASRRMQDFQGPSRNES